jgi:RND family efflux transporter MFP subunit
MRGISFKKIILPLCIGLLGVIGGYAILASSEQKPVKGKYNKIKRLRTVQVSPLVKGSIIPYWDTSGFVMAAETININARVAGNIELVSPFAVPGGALKKGEWLVKLETTDFELALKSQLAQLEQVTASFSLELADQTLAKEELSLLNKNGGLNIDESLVLREPQLTVAKAKVSVAQNNVDKAKLALNRAKVLMPFDGKVINKYIGKGSKVSTGTNLFTVVNTQVYWLEVKIPHKFLALFDKEQMADLSQIRLWGQGQKRQARFVSVLPELDDKDRQVKVLLAIDAPQASVENQPQVFINDFLNVQLKGKPIENAWTIKHSWLQSGSFIWVADKSNTLQKRAVDVLFKGRDVIYVNADFQKGDKALAEKPGIVSVGLAVRLRKELNDEN